MSANNNNNKKTMVKVYNRKIKRDFCDVCNMKKFHPRGYFSSFKK